MDKLNLEGLSRSVRETLDDLGGKRGGPYPAIANGLRELGAALAAHGEDVGEAVLGRVAQALDELTRGGRRTALGLDPKTEENLTFIENQIVILKERVASARPSTTPPPAGPGDRPGSE